MKTYAFTITFIGEGENLDDAWENALASSYLDKLDPEDLEVEILEEVKE